MPLRFFRPLCVLSCLCAAAAAAGEPVPVKWLDNTPPPLAGGVSFGVPWPRGAIQKSQAFTLADASGQSLPVQTWPLAYWPDGSLKWIGVATVAGPGAAGELKLATAAAA